MFEREENKFSSDENMIEAEPQFISRQELDPVFTAEFFKKPEKARELEIHDLPVLPTENDKNDNFQSFLNSVEGAAFCIYAQNLITQFEAWCKEQQIILQQNAFDIVRGYFDPKQEQHYNVAPLYMSGIGDFASFLQLIKEKTIPLEQRKNASLKILEDIAKCPSGISGPLADANLSLATDIRIKLMGIKSEILKDILINKVFKFLVLPNYAGDEIHYLNVINNLIADELGIEKITDEDLINQCSPFLLSDKQKSNDIFSQIKAFFTLEKIIDAIIRDLKLGGLLFETQIKDYPEFNKKIENLVYSLDRWGSDESFTLHELVHYNDDKYSLKTDIDLILARTLLKRLNKSGYIQISYEKEQIKASQTQLVTLYYLPKKSIKFAYIIDEEGEKHSLLTFCLNQLREKNVSKSDTFIDILIEQKADLFSFPTTKFLFQFFLLLLKDATLDPKFDFKIFLESATKVFDEVTVKNLFPNDFAQLGFLLCHLIDEKYRSNIFSLTNSIQTLNDFLLISALHPKELQKEFIVSTQNILLKILNAEVDVDPILTFKYLFWLLKNINDQNRFTLLKNLPIELMQKIIADNFSQMLLLFSLLDPRDKKSFQQHLGFYYTFVFKNFITAKNTPLPFNQILFYLSSPEEFLQALHAWPQDYVLENLQDLNVFFSLFQMLKESDRFQLIETYFINSGEYFIHHYFLDGGIPFLTSIEGFLPVSDKKKFTEFLASRHIFITDEYSLSILKMKFEQTSYEETMEYIAKLANNNNFILYVRQAPQDVQNFLNTVAFSQDPKNINYGALENIFKKFISAETMNDPNKIEPFFKNFPDEYIFTLCQIMKWENIAKNEAMIVTVLSNLKNVSNIIPICAAIGFDLQKNDNLIFKILKASLITNHWEQIKLIKELKLDYLHDFDAERLVSFLQNLTKEMHFDFIEHIPSNALYKICVDPKTSITDILDALDPSVKIEFLKHLKKADLFDSHTVPKLFQKVIHFGEIVESFPSDHRLSFLKLFTDQQIQSILKDSRGLNLFTLFNMLPKHDRFDFLDDVKTILPQGNLADIVVLLDSLPPDQRLMALEVMEVDEIPGNLEAVIRLLELFAAEERFVVLDHLGFPSYVISPPLSEQPSFNQLKKMLAPNDLIKFDAKCKSLREQPTTYSFLSESNNPQTQSSKKNKREDSMSDDEEDSLPLAKHQKKT